MAMSTKEMEYIDNLPKQKAAGSDALAGIFYQLCKKLSMKHP